MNTDEKRFGRAKLRLFYTIWMSTHDGQAVFTDERIQLLIAIHDYGTLREATKVLNVSYRKAWGELRKMETLLGMPLVEKFRGGKDGGFTTLNQQGMVLTKAYKKFLVDFQTAVNPVIKEFKTTLLEGDIDI